MRRGALIMEPIQQTSDHSAADQRKSSFADSAIWMRGLYMLLLLLAFAVAQSLLCIVAVVQFLRLLFAGESNKLIGQFGRSLARWLADTARYVSCSSDVKPFPWAAWPPAE
jgi:hypothetical protein